MSEKGKSLRQFLSKTKISQSKEILEEVKEIPDNKENIEDNKDTDNVLESDIDPLKFFEQPKELIEINNQTSFLDLISKRMDEKQEEELSKYINY